MAAKDFVCPYSVQYYYVHKGIIHSGMRLNKVAAVNQPHPSVPPTLKNFPPTTRLARKIKIRTHIARQT